MKSTIKIATRESKLALWQANWVGELIKRAWPSLNLTIELIKIKTQGDKILNTSLSKIGGKGLFVKELETTLLNGEADIAVHSLKDMPGEQPQGLELVAFCSREDVRDALISKQYQSLLELPLGANVGTSSLRRAAQLKIFRPDLNIISLRGNIDTRIKKAFAKETEYHAIVLASAGIHRLYGLTASSYENKYITEYLPVNHFLPAPGQGIVTVEARSDDTAIKDILNKINCTETSLRAKAERAFNYLLGGSCEIPIAALAEIKHIDKDNKLELTLHGQLASPDGSQQVSASLTGNAQDAVDIGEQLANQLLSVGGRGIIANLQAQR